MFENICINLTGPICNCKEQNLHWSPFVDSKRKYGLKIWCQTCSTAVLIPNSEFKAYFNLKVKYPGKEIVLEKKDPIALTLFGGKRDEFDC